MGMFDSIWFTCPNCGQRIEEQSKAGDCSLHDYNCDEVPLEIAGDIDNNIITCGGDWRMGHERGCGRSYRIRTSTRVTTMKMELVTPNDAPVCNCGCHQ